jgi:hypothetical protein
MGRMTNRFLDSYGLLLNRKLRNEPKATHPVCPMCVPKVWARFRPATHRFLAGDGLPLNPCQNYETNPRPPIRCAQCVCPRCVPEAAGRRIVFLPATGRRSTRAKITKRTQGLQSCGLTKRTQGLQSCGLRNLRNCSSSIRRCRDRSRAGRLPTGDLCRRRSCLWLRAEPSSVYGRTVRRYWG